MDSVGKVNKGKLSINWFEIKLADFMQRYYGKTLVTVKSVLYNLQNKALTTKSVTVWKSIIALW